MEIWMAALDGWNLQIDDKLYGSFTVINISNYSSCLALRKIVDFDASAWQKLDS
jgi:hypothetical protein